MKISKRTIGILVASPFELLDLAGPTAVFSNVTHGGERLYRIRVVTHWQFCAELSSRYPELSIDVNPIFIKDENVYTTAGVSAGIDLALALVEEDWGFGAANAVARYLVLFLRRAGGQAQFSTVLHEQEKVSEPGFRNLPAWALANLHGKLDRDQVKWRSS